MKATIIFQLLPNQMFLFYCFEKQLSIHFDYRLVQNLESYRENQKPLVLKFHQLFLVLKRHEGTADFYIFQLIGELAYAVTAHLEDV